ncbi:phage tail tape measure protein [Natroniella sp. ANB-PHB2]|uniref:phage tail tape measure protein n=1 Tax=Natroniella sp. ANB-PHB2 TaxID=3384444 RepID=UPI0038D4D9B1
MAFAPALDDGNVEIQVGADTRGFTRGMKSAAKELSNFKAIAGAAGVALTALAVKGFADATEKAIEFESAMVEVEKVTDPKTADKMTASILNMANTIPLAHQELAGIAEQAGRLGIEGVDNIENFTEVTAKMSTATDLSAEQAADSFARLTNLMDLPVENVEELGSAVNELANNMGASASEIVDSTVRSSAALSDLGLQQEEILGINAAMNEVSTSSEVAGTHLRTLSNELLDPNRVEALSESFGMTNDEFRFMRNNNPAGLIKMLAQRMGEGGEEAEELRKVFGQVSTQALSGLSKNLEGVTEGFEYANSQFENATALNEEFETAAQATENQMQLLSNQMDTLQIIFGTAFLPAINSVISGFRELLPEADEMQIIMDSLQQKFAENSETLDDLGKMIGLVFGTLGDIAETLLPMVMDNMTRFKDVVGGGFEDILGSIRANNEGFENLQEIVSTVLNLVGNYYIDQFVTKVEVGFATVSGVLDVFGKLLEGDFEGAWDSSIGTVENIIDTYIGFVDRQFTNLSNVLEEQFGVQFELFDQLDGTINDLSALVESAFDFIADNITINTSSITGRLGNVGESLAQLQESFNELRDNVRSVLDENSEQIDRFKDLFKATFGELIGFLSDVVEVSFINLLDIIDGVITSIAKLLTGDFEGALGSLEKTTDRVMSNVRGFFRRQVDRIKRILENDLLGTVEDTVQGVQNWFGETRLGKATETAGNMFGRVTDGASNMYSAVVGNSYVPDMVDDIDKIFNRDLSKAMDSGVNQFELLTDEAEDNLFEISKYHFPNMVDESKDQVEVLGVALDDFTKDELKGLVDDIEVAANMNQVWGDSFDQLEQTQRNVELTINNLIRQGIDPQSSAIQQLKEYYDELEEAQDGYNDGLDEQQEKTEDLINTVTDLFNALADGENTLDNIEEAFTGFLTDTITGDLEEGLTVFESIEGMFSDMGQGLSQLADSFNELSLDEIGGSDMLSAGLFGGLEGLMAGDGSTGSSVTQGLGSGIGALFGSPQLGAAVGNLVGGVGESLWGGDVGSHTMDQVDSYEDALSDASSTLQDFGIDDFMPELDWEDDTSGWRDFWGGSDINIENVDEVEDALERFAEISEELGIVFEDISSGLQSAFQEETFEGFIESFTDTVEQTMRDSLLRTFMQQEMTESLMEDLTGEIVMATEDGEITDEEMDMIQKRYESIISHSQPFFEVLDDLEGLQAPGVQQGIPSFDHNIGNIENLVTRVSSDVDQEIQTQLDNMLESIDESMRMAEVWGDEEGALSEIRRSLRSTIDSLVGQGFDSDSYLIQNLLEQYESLPMLAKGGIATGPTLAMIGEAGPEAVVPFDRVDEFLAAASGEFGPNEYGDYEPLGNTYIEVVITGNKIDRDYNGEKLGKEVVRVLKRSGVA